MTLLEHLNALIRERWCGPTMADYDREKARMFAASLRKPKSPKRAKRRPKHKRDPWNNMRAKLTLYVCPSVTERLKGK